jgi:hypothetical protein
VLNTASNELKGHPSDALKHLFDLFRSVYKLK